MFSNVHWWAKFIEKEGIINFVSFPLMVKFLLFTKSLHFFYSQPSLKVFLDNSDFPSKVYGDFDITIVITICLK